MGTFAADPLLLFGRFALLPRRKLLLEAGEPVRLGSRALELLIALVERAGDVLSREALEAHIWPHTVVEETSLRVHASRLRKALRDGQAGARYIVNVPGRGYVFVAPVVAVHAAAAAERLPLDSVGDDDGTPHDHRLPIRLLRAAAGGAPPPR